jgi:hypothetical protein
MEGAFCYLCLGTDIQSLTILRVSGIEPLVRRLWVPQTKCRIRQGVGDRRDWHLGHPFRAPIRISFFPKFQNVE